MTLADIRSRVLTRIEVNPADAAWKTAATFAINEGLRLFGFLSLCQEAQREFVLTPGVKFYRMLNEGWTDWIAPLRVRLSNDIADGATAEFDAVKADAAMFGEQGYSGLTVSASPKLRPATMHQMASLDSAWLNATGTPARYGCQGWDLLFLDKSPAQSGQKLLITYARNCNPLVLDEDVPELHDADHEALMDYGEFRLRCNEGGQELHIGKLKAFLDAAKLRAAQVRARSLAQRYDKLPFELEGFDYSRLLNPRAGLVPNRKENRWTGQA